MILEVTQPDERMLFTSFSSLYIGADTQLWSIKLLLHQQVFNKYLKIKKKKKTFSDLWLESCLSRQQVRLSSLKGSMSIFLMYFLPTWPEAQFEHLYLREKLFPS